jgi:hypothetical protein
VLKAHGANVCFKCFRGTLQAFYTDVAKVDRDVAYVASISETCCKCFKYMLQAFVQNISFVSDVCCKGFLDVAYISHVYVVRVCSKCFSRFCLML